MTPETTPPPLTAQQRRVIATEGATFLGYDEKGRPVVEMMAGIPQQLRRWALKRDGDPADIAGQVTAPAVARPPKGTPEYALWVAAIEVAMRPPVDHPEHVAMALVPWSAITELRQALEGVGISWREAHERHVNRRAAS